MIAVYRKEKISCINRIDSDEEFAAYMWEDEDVYNRALVLYARFERHRALLRGPYSVRR